MAEKISRKIKIFEILHILKEETDEDHYINAPEICSILAKKGIKCERKSVYSDIDCLIEAGYDIDKAKKGYHLLEREFEIPELCFLSDAVRSAPFITQSRADKLVGKLETFCSRFQRKYISNMVYVNSNRKCKNNMVYICINNLYEAIKTDHKAIIEYKKTEFKNNRPCEEIKEFKISPYAMIWSGDNYYLVCNNDTKENLMHLRIDRILSVKIAEEFRRSFTKFTGYHKEFDVADYADKTFNAFSGERKKVELICDTEIYEMVYDRLGSGADYIMLDDKRIMVVFEAAVSEGLVNWILPYGASIYIKGPEILKSMFKNKLNDISEFQTKV